MKRNVKGWLAASLMLVAVMGTGCLTIEVRMQPTPPPYTPTSPFGPSDCGDYCQRHLSDALRNMGNEETRP